MNGTAAGRVPVTDVSGTHDRAFYMGMACLMALTVLVGFGQTYYFRVGTGTAATISGGTMTPLLQLHGLVFTAWVLLFLVQTALIGLRRGRLHRRLGYASIVLAVAMVVVGLRTAVEAAARGSAPPGVDARAFLVIPLVDIMLFAGFVSMALLKRREREAHKRLMLLAYVSIITAAVARLPGMLPLGPLAFFGLSFMFVVLGMAYDWFSRGTLHPVYAWGAPIIALSVPLRLSVSGTAAWQSFAQWLTR